MTGLIPTLRSRQATYLLVATAVIVAGCGKVATTDNAIDYAPVPESIQTPDSVDTRLGTLEFFDGFPSAESIEKVRDNLIFQRGVRAFLDTLHIASLHAMREGLHEMGVENGTVGIFENLMDSKTLFLTPNTETVYEVAWLDLKDGPIVVESPPNTLGFVDDFFFNYVTDLGVVGPDWVAPRRGKEHLTLVRKED